MEPTQGALDLVEALLTGLVPLAAPTIYQKLGYGWGFSTFGFISLICIPCSLVVRSFAKRVRYL